MRSSLRTPLVRIEVDADAEIYLKLETLQPVNSFKIRGAGNALLAGLRRRARRRRRHRERRQHGPGGRLRGPAARRRRRRSSSPRARRRQSSPPSSASAARVVSLPYDEWWQVLVEGRYDGAAGLFVHPVDDDAVMAGNGTIGLELLEDLPDLDAVVVPYGGGGLITGHRERRQGASARACASSRSSRRRARSPPRASRAGAPDRGRLRALVRRRRRQPLADPARLGARARAASTTRSRVPLDAGGRGRSA